MKLFDTSSSITLEDCLQEVNHLNEKMHDEFGYDYLNEEAVMQASLELLKIKATPIVVNNDSGAWKFLDPGVQGYKPFATYEETKYESKS